MNIESNPKDKTLRNLLLNGLASKEIYTECLKKKGDELTSKKVMEIATNVEARKLMAEDLSEIAKQTLPNNVVAAAGNVISSTSEPVYKIRNEPAFKRQCGWCGSSQRCQRNECSAKDSQCNLCGKMGHWEKVSRSKTRQKGTLAKLHDLTSSAKDQMSDFKTLSTHCDPEAPHLRPMWFSHPLDGIVHLVEAEVDSGAGCNAFPLYLFRRIFKQMPLDPPSVTIKAFGDRPVENLGSKTLQLHVGNKTALRRFQICDVHKHPIIGRELAAEMGYIEFPPVRQPKIAHQAVLQQVNSLSAKKNAAPVKKPCIDDQGSQHVTIDGLRHQLPITQEYVLRQFHDVFSGMGELP